MTDPARDYLKDAAEALHRPLTDAEWRDSVEAFIRARVLADGVADLIKAHAKTTGKPASWIRKAIKARADDRLSEAREELEQQLELFGDNVDGE